MLVKIISVQETGRNTFFNIPKEVKEELNIKKGDKLLVKLEDGRIILEKC
jgi:AbrB family looped-hinge helix DNA binding protein